MGQSAGSGGGGSPATAAAFLIDESQRSPTTSKAVELLRLFEALERGLAATPQVDVRSVGAAYADLAAWAGAHQWDKDMEGALQWLGEETVYLPWRRQALEEAYRLFYEDVASSGSEQVADLPEPPTSEEMGFRKLNEALANNRAIWQAAVRGSYQDSTCVLQKSRWEYQIRRMPPAKEGGISGRHIVHTGFVEDASIAARAFQGLGYMLPVECCAQRESALKLRGPFFLPGGSRGPPPMKRPPSFEGPPM